MRSPVGRARGLGTAREGTTHWWAQRLSAVALVPLSFFAVWLVITLARAGHAEVVAAFANPLIALAMILFTIACFWHLKLGVQVIVEDYVHGEAIKTALLIAVALGSFALGTACVFAVAKMAFAG
jgi:succinate dehydrogenase / fumarate reductase membrane anchor subunit